MLILTRRPGETVMIGSEVTLTVLGVKGNQVRIGINAPKNVPVHREEIYDRIKREMQGGEVGMLADHRQGNVPTPSPPDRPLGIVHSAQCDCQLCMTKNIKGALGHTAV